MKKYLASLIPVVFCVILAFAYNLKTPNPKYSYQTEEALSGIAFVWIVIGVIISCALASMFFIGDVFDWLVKLIEKARQKKVKE